MQFHWINLIRRCGKIRDVNLRSTGGSYLRFTRLFSTRTFRSSSPGSSTGVSAMNAQCAKPRVIQQPPKRLYPHRPLSDVLVPVQLRSPLGLRVIAVPHPHRVKTHGHCGLFHVSSYPSSLTMS